ncbi:cytochrome b561 [Mycobacterium frederiksbergense]|uniref:Cytochrome b561 n=1 Tax=Mycolicibacterium frederiksbergense TaxID=117567 RepID=A0ABT6KUR1_9MYCO|nr:cytochrome b/b6 domain-containing protein [Mycolicibacterium frederiksbergense]MDH6193727.1 cytochrome b561 [Mycolicibacterium frederiksbergense]
MSTRTAPPVTRFNLLARLLHWSMAVMVIAQFFIGVTMIAALSYYPLLLAIHRPLGIAILVFAIVRLANRLTRRLPPFLATMSPLERRVASYSEYLLYALLLVQPLIGWAMLSAAQSPIVLAGQLHLPGIAPHDITLYAALRTAHTVSAYLLFATFTAHICAVVFHTVGLRDGIIGRMALWPRRSQADETAG